MAGLPNPPVFGPGLVWVKNLTDINGLAIAVPSPRRMPNVQEFTCDIDLATVPLYGENQWAIALARKPGKMTGKVKFTGFNAIPINTTLVGSPGGVIAGNGDQIAWDQIYSIPSSGPFTITPTIPAGGTFAEDLGVRYSATGAALQNSASAAAQGEYTVSSAGVYTFESGDAGAGVAIDFRYTVSGGVSQVALTQQPLGNTPTFELTYRGVYRGLQVVAVIYNCVSDKMSLFGSKLDNWTMPEMDFEVFEPTGIVNNPVSRWTFSQP